jgi:hypothetical protein
VVVLQIPHIGLQLLDASLDVQPSVLQLRLLEQRLLVFQVPTLPIPPVTNKKKLATYKIRNREKIPRENTTNLPKKIDLWNTKSYHRHLTAKRSDSKLKKATKEHGPPPHHFNRTVPATTEPEKGKNLYSPAIRSKKVPE